MARLFDGTDDVLVTDTPPATAAPFACSAWFMPDDVAASYQILSILKAGVNNITYWRLNSAGATAGDPLQLVVHGGISSSTLAVNGITAGVWHHAYFVEESTTSRYVALNNTWSAQNTDDREPLLIDRLSIGASEDLIPAGHFAGKIAEVACWAPATAAGLPTVADVKRLSRGADPRTVRPGSLTAYWPLRGRYSPERDLAGTNTLTITGAAASDVHPKILLTNARRRRRGAMIGA